MFQGSPAVVPSPPAPDPGVVPSVDDPPPPAYLCVGVGADWFAGGGHGPMAGDGPGSGSDAPAWALDAVAVSYPQCVLDP